MLGCAFILLTIHREPGKKALVSGFHLCQEMLPTTKKWQNIAIDLANVVILANMVVLAKSL